MTRINLAPRPTFKQTITPSTSTAKPKKVAPWAGVDWGLATARPGCQDFLACPSRRGDQLIAHRPPILNAASTK